MNLDLNGMTVANAISEQVGKIGEKIEATDYAAIDAASVVAYNHSNGKVKVY